MIAPLSSCNLRAQYPIPLHEVSPVNMKTLRLEVKRVAEGALITKDRMRVDVGVEFSVSVQATEDGISRAAQRLGARTFNVDQLREMIEGKLIDGLRAVAARMTMDELHENRTSFVQEVQNAVSNDLLKNGLELESVSLTALDQTPFEALDENDAGMRKLAEVIATSKKERAQIDAEAEVAVRRAAMEAEKLKLQIARDEEEARIARTQEIELLKAAQEAEIARSREAAESEKERARIAREQQIRAEAKKADLLAEAEGRQALANSENTLSPEIVAMRIALARLEAMPTIVQEMVKPAEKIDSIRINQISGLAQGGAAPGEAASKAPVNQAFDAMLGAALQLPVMKKLGEEIGVNFDDGLAGMLGTAPKAEAPKQR